MCKGRRHYHWSLLQFSRALCVKSLQLSKNPQYSYRNHNYKECIKIISDKNNNKTNKGWVPPTCNFAGKMWYYWHAITQSVNTCIIQHIREHNKSAIPFIRLPKILFFYSSNPNVRLISAKWTFDLLHQELLNALLQCRRTYPQNWRRS